MTPNSSESLFPQPDPRKNQPQVYTVTEITQNIRAILETAFDAIWIEGEISNLRVASSKHTYFVLKDQQAQIRCVMFRHQRTRLKFDPADGDHVLLFGRVTVYDQRGEYQLIVETLEPRGLGALQKAFEQLKEKLSKEGLFDEAAKKTIPPFPWKVGVITSPTGAAIQDIVHVITRRNPKTSILISPVKVQGEGAAQEIAKAIEEMNQFKEVQVLIVGRGGGSIEDLWAFNEECVARAIYASRIPVVSAVGHEIDFTIADFTADLRAPTPSAAAELVVPVLEDVCQDLRSLTQDLFSSLRRQIGNYKELLRNYIGRRFFREPMQIVQPASQRLDDANQKLVRALNQWLILRRERLTGKVQRLVHASPEKNIQRFKEKRSVLQHQIIRQMMSLIKLNRERFEGIIKNLNALNPLSILERGYSICTSKRTGKAVKSSDHVNKGDQLLVRLAKGKLECRVEEKIQ